MYKNSFKTTLKRYGMKNIEEGYYKWLKKLVKDEIFTISIIDKQLIE